LDSDASHHMIKEELFDFTHNRRKLRKPIKVTLAKADQAITVSEIADINLSKGRSTEKNFKHVFLKTHFFKTACKITFRLFKQLT